MKKITQLLLFLLLSIPIQGTLLAQCGPGQNVIQDQTNANYTTPGTSEYAQDFIVNCDGAIEAVKIIFVGVVVPSSGTLKVYSDLAGTIVIASSATISLPVGNSTQIIPLTSPLPVTNGTPYLFAFIEDNTEQIGYRAYNSDVYPDGNLKVRGVGGTIWNETPYDLYFEVMYRDDVAPVAVCQNYTAQLDATGSITITGADVDGGSSDDSGSFTLSLDTDTFSCADKGANTVTLTITDGAGNTDTCTATVTVVDTIDPIISCPAPISVSNDLGTCGAVVTYSQPTASDNCSSGVLNILFVSDNGAATEIETALINEGHSVTAVYNDYSGGDNATLQGALASYDLIYWHASGSVGYGDTHNLATFTNLDSFVANGGNVFVTGYDVIANPTDSNMISFLGGTSTNDIAPSYGTLNGPNNLTTGFSDITGMTITAPNGDQDNLNGLAPSVITVLPGSATGGAEWAINDVPGGEIAWVSSGQSGTSTFSAWTTVGSGYHEALLNFAFNTSGVTPTQTAGLPSGATFPVGTTTNTFVVTDAAGNTATCSFDVTVEDNEAPMITCIADDTRDTDAGVCQYTVVGTEFDATFTDNCTSGSITNDFNGTATLAGEILPIGVTTVVWTVDDGNGQSATCTTVITVEDNEAPMIACIADDTRDTDPGVCQYTVVGTEFDATFTDNCTSATITNDFNGTATIAGEILPIGVTTVVWTVDDGNGQSATCTTVITVEDNEAPMITCVADDTRDTDAGVCQYTVVGTEFDATFTDNCTSVTITNDFNGTATIAGEILPIGVTTVVWTVDDGNGQSASCTTVITVEDNEAPMITCIADDTRDTDAGVCQYTVVGTEFDATFTDNCTSGSITNDFNGTATIAGEILPKGITTVLWTVNDGNGQSATCTTVITVEDNEAPMITCVADDTRDTDPGVCQYTVVGTEFDATFTDNCSDGSITNDLNGTATIAGEIFTPGITTVVWTVDDGNGQSATCTTVITVEDNEAPVMACPTDVVANTDLGICGAVVIFSDAIAFDNCGIASVIQTAGLSSGSLFPVGVSTIEYTATDINGNNTTCDFTITITDNEVPITVCQDITIQLDATGTASIIASDVDGGSTDNCGIASTTIDMDTFDCSNVGPNNVTLTVTDVNGNVSTCIAVVTVEDITAPVVVCQDITVQLDPTTGTVTILGADVDGGSTDVCGIASYDLDIDTFDCSNIGDNPVILTVTDSNGNTATCSAIVTVEDNTMPELVCMDFTIELDENGMATLTPDDVIATNTDACGIQTTAVDITEFSCSDIGTPVTVQIFSQDMNGNLATCNATVTVVDLLGPEVTCPADQTVDPGTGNLFYEVPDYFATGEATATDNCTDPVVITSQDPAAGTLLSDGVYTVTCTAEDAYGNVSNCTFQLTVDSVLGTNDATIDVSSIGLYPNPASDFVNINNPQLIHLKQLHVYDLMGRLVISESLESVGASKAIDVSILQSATYMFIIQTENGQIRKQIIKD
ncbi:HYR domain-containing protein [Ulvibacter litoralis]|uniref:Por secretion system C-terminal sorting domain-containing protein n=1 Tax=Ulvibacter litoralis TaxID=227084 RepID=A0A1G7GCW4_9FLAO|nr:HYR domain-containing protein [Ulvibacter litoralis]GHC56745.1 hypothetical protein GCM10008083_21670 [Ulvibacter litoralis]SDE85923.1 Por secretion system C-terminal sorting domain-containing protein [Ulvibacter litoralis]